MNREILFRAKRVCGDEWVEGYYLNCYYPGNSTEQTGYFIVEYPGKYHEIYLKTLCQYTGLTDKNGMKIFEGDYISCNQYVSGSQIDYHVESGYVEMKYGAFGLHRNQGYYRPFKDWLEDYEYEVIGNIFDNPELIEN